MEPQFKEGYCEEKKEKCCKKKNCLGIIATILLTLFTLSIGLLVGAALSSTILAQLPAFIVVAVILGILLALTAIYMLCRKKEKKYKCC